MVNSIQVQIETLKTDQLLANDPQFSNNREVHDQGFYVTAEGRLYIRKHYQGLISLIENKKKYNNIIDEVQATSDEKKYLKNFRNKLVKKSEDKIIDTIVSEAVKKGTEYGHILIRLAVVLLQHWQHVSVHGGQN
jgi:hypothetical protein